MNDKLKPCLWCNNDKQKWLYVQGVDFFGDVMFQVCCYNCGARGPMECSSEEAKVAWNKRS